MTNKRLELNLEGNIYSNSGELLIIDPAYLNNYESYLDLVNKLEEPFYEKINNLLEEEFKLSDERSTVFEQIDKLPANSKAEEFSQLVHSLSVGLKQNEQRMRIIQKKRMQLQQEPFFSSPYLGQGEGYVILHTPFGDGYYPVVQTPRRVHIVYNYPLKEGLDGIKLDEERLGGKLIGYSGVDSGLQIIIDPQKIKIQDDTPSDVYCKLIVPQKYYSCKFIKDDHALSIEKI